MVYICPNVALLVHVAIHTLGQKGGCEFIGYQDYPKQNCARFGLFHVHHIQGNFWQRKGQPGNKEKNPKIL